MQPPPGLYGVFFRPAQARRRLAGIQQAHAGSFELLNIAGRQIGDARKMGDKVEDDALGAQQQHGGAVQAGHCGHGGHAGGFFHIQRKHCSSAQSVNDLRDNGQTDNQRVFLGPDDGMQRRIGWKEPFGRQIGTVFVKRQTNGATQQRQTFRSKKLRP